MENVIVDANMINYIGQHIRNYTGYQSFRYYDIDQYHNVELYQTGSFDNDLHALFNNKTLIEVIIIISNSNLNNESKMEVVNYVTNPDVQIGIVIDTINETKTELADKINDLEKLIHIQNDKMNILVDALDIMNKNRNNH